MSKFDESTADLLLHLALDGDTTSAINLLRWIRDALLFGEDLPESARYYLTKAFEQIVDHAEADANTALLLKKKRGGSRYETYHRDMEIWLRTRELHVYEGLNMTRDDVFTIVGEEFYISPGAAEKAYHRAVKNNEHIDRLMSVPRYKPAK